MLGICIYQSKKFNSGNLVTCLEKIHDPKNIVYKKSASLILFGPKEIKVFDKLGYLTLDINIFTNLLKSIAEIYNGAPIKKQDIFVHINEYIFENNIETALLFSGNNLYFTNLKRSFKQLEVQKSCSIRNLFQNNYQSIINLNLTVNNKYIYESFINNDEKAAIKYQSSALTYIFSKLGAPHLIIPSPDYHDVFVYFGLHKCKNGIKTGYLAFAINDLYNIKMIIKNMEVCTHCSKYKENNIKSFENVDY
jgi:hypothetical protein